MDEEKQPLLNEGVGEAWRCEYCGLFVYNLKFIDGRYVPVSGSSPSRFLSSEYPRVCNVCFQLHLALCNSDYWCALQGADKKANEAKKRLKPGQDYFK